jgi:hypothetical protein
VTNRRRRNERRSGVRVVMGPRDEALLRGLARLRIARTSDLLALFFRHVRTDTAQARLRKLLDAGYVSVAVPNLNVENVYSLGLAGRAWADAHGIAWGRPPTGGQNHHLAVVQAWTRLAAALHGHTNFLLRSFTPDWERRQRLAGASPAVVSDGEVEVRCLSNQTSSATQRLILEVDLGTERRGELERKLTAHQLADAAHSVVGLAIVLVGAGAVRCRNVSTLVEQLWPGWALVCPMEEWPEALLGQLASLSQPPPTASPHGKGRPSLPSPSEAENCDLSGDQHSRSCEHGDAPER